MTKLFWTQNFFDSKLCQDKFKDDFTSTKLSSTQLGTTQPQLVSFHTTAILHAWEVFSLSGCTYATKLVNYKLIHWPYSLKMAVFWPKMAPKMASNGNISSFFFMDSEKLFKIHYCIKFPSIWINIGQVLAYFVFMNNNKIGSMLSFLHFSWLTI